MYTGGLTLDHHLDGVCKVCGATYGEHRMCDDACPDPECETRDYKGGWLPTKYQDAPGHYQGEFVGESTQEPSDS